jgi:hypothetical protein
VDTKGKLSARQFRQCRLNCIVSNGAGGGMKMKTLSNFTQDEYNKFIKKDTVQLSNGKGFYDIKMDEDNGAGI